MGRAPFGIPARRRFGRMAGCPENFGSESVLTMRNPWQIVSAKMGAGVVQWQNVSFPS